MEENPNTHPPTPSPTSTGNYFNSEPPVPPPVQTSTKSSSPPTSAPPSIPTNPTTIHTTKAPGYDHYEPRKRSFSVTDNSVLEDNLPSESSGFPVSYKSPDQNLLPPVSLPPRQQSQNIIPLSQPDKQSFGGTSTFSYDFSKYSQPIGPPSSINLNTVEYSDSYTYDN